MSTNFWIVFFFLLSIATSTPTEYQPFAGSSSKLLPWLPPPLPHTHKWYCVITWQLNAKHQSAIQYAKPKTKFVKIIQTTHARMTFHHTQAILPGTGRISIVSSMDFFPRAYHQSIICVVLSQCHLNRISLHTIFLRFVYRICKPTDLEYCFSLLICRHAAISSIW